MKIIRPRKLKPGEETRLVEDCLLSARSSRPYYARAFAALTPMAVDGLGTVAVDKNWRLYIDTEWLASLDIKQRAGVIAEHEIEHLLRNHHRRFEGKDHEKANRAGDLAINCDADPTHLPENVLYPERMGLPRGLSSEEYYDLLPDAKCTGTCGGGSGAGNAHDWELPESDSTPGVSEKEAESLKDSVAKDVINHSKAGDVPAGIVMWAKERITPPKVDWRRQLRSIVSKKVHEIIRGRTDYSWSKLSRRGQQSRILRPGTVTPKPRVGLVVDTSSSMCGDGQVVISEAIAIIRTYKTCVWTADAEITGKSYGVPTQWVGGGGTDLSGAMAEAAKWGDIVVVLTDGEFTFTGKIETPVIAVLTSDIPFDSITWAGTKIRVTSDNP